MFVDPGVFVFSSMFPGSDYSSSGCFSNIGVFALLVLSFPPVNEVTDLFLVLNLVESFVPV